MLVLEHGYKRGKAKNEKASIDRAAIVFSFISMNKLRIPVELTPLLEIVRSFPTASKFERYFTDEFLRSSLFPAQNAYFTDNTILGEGVKLHELADWGGEVLFQLWKGRHSKAVELEVNYYRFLIPELAQYSIKSINQVIIRRLHEKYGKDLYGLRKSAPIPFIPKNQKEKEIYRLIRHTETKIVPSALQLFYHTSKEK